MSLSTNSIFASFLLQSSRKRYEFSLSHFIFHVLSVLFLILWVCCCHYALKNIMFIRGHALSWWVFFDWELVFLTILLLFIWSLCSVLYFMNVLLHSWNAFGILSHYLSFEYLWCSLPTWFWVIIVHHYIRLPIPIITSVLLMISWYWPSSCFCDWVKSPCFTLLYLNLIKLMCVPCGIAFGSLLCVYSLVDDLSFP